MPFRSEKQRRWMWANEPEMAEEWEDEEDKKQEGALIGTREEIFNKMLAEAKVIEADEVDANLSDDQEK